MEALTAYKFAKDVMPLLLADAASQHRPTLQAAQPVPQQEQQPAAVPPAQAQVSAPDQAQNIPQGQTAVTAPAVAAPRGLEPHKLGQPAQKTAVNLPQPLNEFGNSALEALNRAAVNYHLNGVPGLVSEPTSKLIVNAKKVLQAALAKYKAAPKYLKHAVAEKKAGLGGAAANFGRGAFAVTKPLTGLLRGGVGGAGRGIASAANTLYKGGPAAAAGAATAAYLGYNSLRNPIVQYGDGFKVQSPVHVPAMRVQSPMTWAGNGVKFQAPVRTLW